MPFQKGQSGNPNGRPRKPRVTPTALFNRISAELPAVIDKLVDHAKDGDTRAAKLLLERVYPAVRPQAQPVAFHATGTLTELAEGIVQGISQGAIPPDTGAYILTALGGLARLKELDELERRMAALETQEHESDENDPL